MNSTLDNQNRIYSLVGRAWPAKEEDFGQGRAVRISLDPDFSRAWFNAYREFQLTQDPRILAEINHVKFLFFIELNKKISIKFLHSP